MHVQLATLPPLRRRCGGRATRPFTRASWRCTTPCPQSEPRRPPRCRPAPHSPLLPRSNRAALCGSTRCLQRAARLSMHAPPLGGIAGCTIFHGRQHGHDLNGGPALHAAAPGWPSCPAAQAADAPCWEGSRWVGIEDGASCTTPHSPVCERQPIPAAARPAPQAHGVLRRRRGWHAPAVAARRAHPAGVPGGAVAARRGAGAAAPGGGTGAAAHPRPGAPRAGEGRRGPSGRVCARAQAQRPASWPGPAACHASWHAPLVRYASALHPRLHGCEVAATRARLPRPAAAPAGLQGPAPPPPTAPPEGAKAAYVVSTQELRRKNREVWAQKRGCAPGCVRCAGPSGGARACGSAGREGMQAGQAGQAGEGAAVRSAAPRRVGRQRLHVVALLCSSLA